MFVNRCMDKYNIVYTHIGILLRHEKECSSAHAVAWMKLGDFLLSEMHQTQKDKDGMIPLT